jgi:diguanylate cyclase (GGDEF)-like protein
MRDVSFAGVEPKSPHVRPEQAAVALAVLAASGLAAGLDWTIGSGWMEHLALGGVGVIAAAALALRRISTRDLDTMTRRIGPLAAVMRRMARQEKVAEIPEMDEPGLLGDMARALAVLRADSDEVVLRGQELEETHARFDSALNNMVHGLLMIDTEFRVVLCNRQMHALFNFDPDIVRPGASMDQLIHHSVSRGNHPGQSASDVLAEMRKRGAAGQRVSFEQSLPNGRLLSVHWEPMPCGGWVCTYEDITIRMTAIARVTHLARHDITTGLPNRLALHEALLGSWPQRQAGGFNLLCVEIERFHAICDACGHRGVDSLLRAVAERLAGCVRGGDLVAHLGGAGFAILQSAPASREAALTLAERVADILQAPVTLDGRLVVTAASIGIATSGSVLVCASAEAGAEQMLRNGTLALHRASSDSDHRVQIYADDMDRSAQARHTLESDLRAALAAGQFEVHYQPLVSVSEHRVTGFEALLRWRHPTNGMISPAVFIPLAEELGLIRAIGAWTLRTACAEAATWPDNVRVAVNLSPLQFAAVGGGLSLPVTVAMALADSGLSGQRLELEITESVRLQDDAATLDTLHQLRGLGARISLDDFGTGYSSLSYLRCFPFDKLKIDQSFVRSLPAAGSAAIVRAVAALGSSLGIATVAEGVETADQLRALVAEACDEMQGYLFSPPRPAADVPALLASAVAAIAA